MMAGQWRFGLDKGGKEREKKFRLWRPLEKDT